MDITGMRAVQLQQECQLFGANRFGGIRRENLEKLTAGAQFIGQLCLARGCVTQERHPQGGHGVIC